MADFEEQLARLQDKIRDLQAFAREQGLDLRREILALEQKAAELRARMYASLSPWQKVQLARDVRRPTTLDYIDMLFTDFIQLHGDRQYRDDPALVGGIARLEGKPVTVLGHQKGRDTKDNIARNFGMPHPEGYRKALRLMEQAEKFGRPVICFIDTPGAYPGLGAEERGQGEAIARNLRAMAALAVPVLAVVTGEGGSGGALALGVGDALLMLEHAVYSVISRKGAQPYCGRIPPGQGSGGGAKLTAQDLARLGVADEVIPEPQGGIQKDWQAGARAVKAALVRHLDILSGLSADTLLRRRQRRLAAIGQWREH